ncbi:MAG: DUF1588 domain-containing protein [Bdellovibrionota bacterium]
MKWNKSLRLVSHCFVILLFLQVGCSFVDSNSGSPNREGEAPKWEQGKTANLLGAHARLRKLSLHIRGLSPSSEEYDNLESSISQGLGNKFFNDTLERYLKSPQHLGKMIERLEDLFGVRLNTLPAEKYFHEIPSKIKDITFDINSMDLLFRKVIHENTDWNTLFTAREYQILYPSLTLYNRPSDLGFLNAIKTDLPPSSDGLLRIRDKDEFQGSPIPIERSLMPVNFVEKDIRVAGAFTTSRFMSRYNTTLLNKNRKRAAALFRILLCDNMKPIIQDNEDISDLLAKAFPRTEQNPSPIIRSAEMKHGTEQTCMSCHQKLDPMGQTFRTSGNVLSSEAAPGALTYPTNDNKMVHVPVSGLGELVDTVTQQQEYAQCQVRHFWNWFIGKDIPLSYSRLEDLRLEFERVKRKPSDFVTYLVQQKEFLQDVSGTFSRDVTFAQIRPIMKQCASCHSGASNSLPNFENLPFGRTKQAHKTWIERIIVALDLAGSGAQAAMPPANSGWVLKKEEMQDFRNWINDGARDDNGLKTIEDGAVQRLPKPPTSSNTKTGIFGYAGLRYLSAMDLLRTIEQKFPNGWNGEFCVSNMDPKVLGFFNAETQEPTLQGPSLAFIKWLSKCLLEISKSEFVKIKADNKSFEKYLGKKVLESIAGTPQEDLIKNADKFAWKKVSPEIQSAIALHLVQDFIGRDTATDESELVEKALMMTKDSGDKMTTEALQLIILAAALNDEFLTY